MAFKMRWLGTACFEILLPARRAVVIDPFLDEAVGAPITVREIDACDVICLTHGHYDHVIGSAGFRATA